MQQQRNWRWKQVTNHLPMKLFSAEWPCTMKQNSAVSPPLPSLPLLLWMVPFRKTTWESAAVDFRNQKIYDTRLCLETFVNFVILRAAGTIWRIHSSERTLPSHTTKYAVHQNWGWTSSWFLSFFFFLLSFYLYNSLYFHLSFVEMANVGHSTGTASFITRAKQK